MAKPILIAKKPGPEWSVSYIAQSEPNMVSVYGSATIEDALADVRQALRAEFQDDYSITGIQLMLGSTD